MTIVCMICHSQQCRWQTELLFTLNFSHEVFLVHTCIVFFLFTVLSQTVFIRHSLCPRSVSTKNALLMKQRIRKIKIPWRKWNSIKVIEFLWVKMKIYFLLMKGRGGNWLKHARGSRAGRSLLLTTFAKNEITWSSGLPLSNWLTYAVIWRCRY